MHIKTATIFRQLSKPFCSHSHRFTILPYWTSVNSPILIPAQDILLPSKHFTFDIATFVLGRQTWGWHKLNWLTRSTYSVEANMIHVNGNISQTMSSASCSNTMNQRDIFTCFCFLSFLWNPTVTHYSSTTQKKKSNKQTNQLKITQTNKHLWWPKFRRKLNLFWKSAYWAQQLKCKVPTNSEISQGTLVRSQQHE